MGFDNVSSLSGLFHILSTKEDKCGYPETVVLSWNHFWGLLQQPSFTPFTFDTNNVFEYLEAFEINDPKFYNHCRNNTMDLKLWEKKENSFKELLTVPIKLHPFFDSFSNPKIANHIHEESMPVVSFTDWIDVRIGSAIKPILSAKIQVELAIGTTDQLNAFKTSKNITILPCATSKTDTAMPKKANPTALADMLSTFIDNLALNLPKRSESDQRQQYATDPRYQIRRTSDLLDVLQNALKNPVPVNLIQSPAAFPFKLSGKVVNSPTNDYQISSKENIRVIVSVDSARNLTSRNDDQDCQRDDTRNTSSTDERPSTYVSFEAIDCGRDGQSCTTYATKIAQNNCNPCWNEKFNVMLPVDFTKIENDNKFILKVCRKSHDPERVNQDEIVGVAAIDLNSLSLGSPISGYHNIVDSASETVGQIKINIIPTDDVNYQENSKNSTDDTELPNNLKDLENGSFNVDNIILSRTLKRKFTELEEISQRLKSRLLDVTADDDFDLDDEFENDLNTCPNEDDIDSNGEFDWNRFSTLEIDCGAGESDNGTVDGVDFLTNSFKHSALNISEVDAKNSTVDGNTSLNVQHPE